MHINQKPNESSDQNLRQQGSYLNWDVLHCEHRSLKDYAYFDEHNLNRSEDQHERFFSSSLNRYLSIHPELAKAIKNS